MNKVSIIGRLTKEPEIITTAKTTIATFTVAVDRKYKDSDGQRQADFITCKAFGSTAEFIRKYFGKGQKIALSGSIQTGSYKNKDGATVYTTDVIVDEAEFVEPKQKETAPAAEQEKAPEAPQETMPESEEIGAVQESLPFEI